MHRRSFLSLGTAAMFTPWHRLLALPGTSEVFRRLLVKATEDGWVDLPIGDLVSALGHQLLGTPYVGGTLEAPGPEECRIDLTGLDCVTFVENALGMARMLKLGGASIEEMAEEITYTRYRGGVLDGYLSRLHYTAEWIADGVTKGVVRDITPELGGEPLTVDVHFMTQRPELYPQLKGQPALVNEMKTIEATIRRIPRSCIPTARIAEIENRLRTGDIIAIATSKKGLDYAHMGMVVRGDEGTVLMHASSTRKKVVMDGRLSTVIGAVSTHTGITVVRPLEP